MLSKIDNNRFADLFFIFPEKDAVLSNNIEVKGWSKRPPDRHLWLFVHPKGGSDWMPQADEVLLEPDGKWKHVIFLGKEEESKAVFELEQSGLIWKLTENWRPTLRLSAERQIRDLP